MKNESQKMAMFRKYGIVMALVFEMIVCVVLGFLAGRWIDQRLNLEGIGLISGVLLGFVFGFYRFVKDLRRFIQ
ncbi:MAG: AtpZ/AtpI family protein [Deltaproteobacteria bacterium]|nr:AtpZ/AtpI family protein [Deltaproteobacteria bacterium]